MPPARLLKTSPAAPDYPLDMSGRPAKPPVMGLVRGFLFFLVFTLAARAVVEGEPDTFAPVLNGAVHAMLPTSDGGVLIAGAFTEVNGTPCGRIAKLMIDGTLDPAFNPGSGADGPILCLAITSGGYYIGGDFLNYDGVARGRIARIGSTGALVTSFNPGLGANAAVRCLSTDSQNSTGSTTVWVGGDFTQFHGVTTGYFAVLNSSGQFNSSFITGSLPKSTMAANAPVRAIVSANEGMMVGGDFTTWAARPAVTWSRSTGIPQPPPRCLEPSTARSRP